MRCWLALFALACAHASTSGYRDQKVLHEREPRLIWAVVGAPDRADQDLLLDCDGRTCETIVADAPMSAPSFRIMSVSPFVPGVLEVTVTWSTDELECTSRVEAHLLLREGRKVCEWRSNSGCEGGQPTVFQRGATPDEFLLVTSSSHSHGIFINGFIRHMKLPADDDPAHCQVGDPENI